MRLRSLPSSSASSSIMFSSSSVSWSIRSASFSNLSLLACGSESCSASFSATYCPEMEKTTMDVKKVLKGSNSVCKCAIGLRFYLLGLAFDELGLGL